MAGQHTPGPWTISHVAKSRTNSTPTRHIVAPGGPLGSKRAIVSLHGSGPEKEANARLIAAAPDLLEALIVAEIWLSPVGVPQPIVEQIRAAIAKAEGR